MISQHLNFVTRVLPEGSEDPTIIKFNSSMMPIIFYAITANESYTGLERYLMRKYKSLTGLKG